MTPNQVAKSLQKCAKAQVAYAKKIRQEPRGIGIETEEDKALLAQHFERDAMVISDIALLVEQGYIEEAAKRVDDLSTSLRDEVPEDAFQFLMDFVK